MLGSSFGLPHSGHRRRLSTPRRRQVASLVAAVAACLTTTALVAPAARGATASTTRGGRDVTVVHYDSTSLSDYHQKWTNFYGPLDDATESFSHGTFTASDVPFKPGTDFSVYDHLKYFALSNESFPVPQRGTISFSADIKASTPGTQPGHVVHGVYGPPGSWAVANAGTKRFTQRVLRAQQAAAVLDVVDFCTGQLFDWFVSDNQAFPLVERLPSTVTNNLTNPACPNATDVTLDKAYTQIPRIISVRPGVTHRTSIAYSQANGRSNVTFSLDGRVVASVNDVGVPLDKRPAQFAGIYPSLGPGEPLAGKITTFQIQHGLLSLLDEFPFQYGCTPATPTGPGVCDPATAPYSVSVSPAQRSFGQGAVGSFSHFTITTAGR